MLIRRNPLSRGMVRHANSYN